MDSLFKRLTAIGDTLALMKYLQASTIEEAQANTAPNRKTGHLQRSIVRGQVNATSATVKVNVPYAASLEYGARPHIIKPKRAKVLAWGGSRRLSGRLRSGASADHFAAFVHHPGNKPYPYLIPGAKRAIEKSHEIVVKEWNGAA
jgi:hypothetical protein